MIRNDTLDRKYFDKPKILTNVPGDLAGGLSSALMALPGNIIYGMIAFSPLGPEYLSQGILAGLYASVFAGFFATVFGGIHGMITGPRAPAVLVFGSVIGQVLASGHFSPGLEHHMGAVIALGFATVLLSGILLIVFGFLRLGKLVKYVSFPVIAGIMNGTMIMIIAQSIWNFLGIPRQEAFWQIFTQLDRIKPLMFIIALTSTLLWREGEKWFPKIPGALLSLLGGSALYYVFSALGFQQGIGETLGSIPASIPVPRYLFGFMEIFSDRRYLQFAPIMITGALTIALLSSIESLLAILTIQNLTDERGDANRELIGQGIGNIANALFGAIPAGGASARVMVNLKAGGRTKLSGIAFSLITLLMILLFSRFIGLIPKAVTAGMALAVGLLVLDRWSIKLLKNVFRPGIRNRRELLVNLGIIVLVMIAVVYYGIIVAVGLGIILSVLIFVEEMSRSVVRRIMNGKNVRSKKQRYFKMMEHLEMHGARIAVVELEGPIFFGATDSFLKELDRLVDAGALYIILDWKRVTGIDVSGERVLNQTCAQLGKKGVTLIFSYLDRYHPTWSFLCDLGLVGKVPESHLFCDTDAALEFCEDELLKRHSGAEQSARNFALIDFLGWEDTGESYGRLERYFKRERFGAGETIFRQSDAGDSAYIIEKGTAAVSIALPDADRLKRLTTLSYGTIFGEMALLDGSPRSADVIALEDMCCYRISAQDFEKMKRDDPDMAMIMLETLSRLLSARLRQANLMIAELDR